MRGRRLLNYRDAVAILTGDSASLAAADRALGGALSMATGGVSDAVLSVFDAQGRVLRLGRDLTAGLGGNPGGADRATRTERINAAHTVLVITAWFQALGEAELPFRLAELELTRREQLAIAGGHDEGDLLGTLFGMTVPQPAPHLPYEQVLRDLEFWYAGCGGHLLLFLQGLAVHDRLDEADRERTERVLQRWTRRRAVERYQELYAQLAQEVPEFGFWSGQIEHQATRVAIRRALSGIETTLAGLSTPPPLSHAAEALVAGYRAALPKPILSEGEAPAGMCLPTLDQGYVDHEFRVRRVGSGTAEAADESWWAESAVRSDLSEYLAGVLTTVASTTAPLVVLGQPGAGKSVLTKILAARLPATGYLPVRVVLREVPADADIQDQIEYAVRASTGERLSWPELVRAADSAVPVLLFDGFDELLQATGVSQSDFLVRVARFQEREADQGRPLYAIVTSRTAVADRVRYPDGSVALRLEPFSEPQTERWLEQWNRLNESYLAGRGLEPLPAAVAVRHRALASQPLLLLMLALYDATANALQRGSGADAAFDEAALYEELLVSFAQREVRKSVAASPDREIAHRAEQELQRLSLISFGMLNRRRQWIATAEMEQDLSALLGHAENRRSASAQDGFRAELDQGEIALGRFFFVQHAQAVRDEQRLATYEFLHATFGEYLIARLAVQLLEGLLGQRPALSVGRTSVDDDLLYVLLSYATLSSRQILRFARARIARIPSDARARLGELLITVMADHRNRTEHRYTDYRPQVRATTSRHGLYSANLLTLTVLVTGGVRASELFPGVRKPAARWHRRVLLWRAAFREAEWTDFAMALRVSRIWNESGQQDLDIRPDPLFLARPEQIDVVWLYGRQTTVGTHERVTSWSRSDPEQIRHKMSVSGGVNDSIVLHTADPFFRSLPWAVTTFVGPPDTATSIAHALTALWLTSGLGAPRDELIAQYENCAEIMATWGNLDEPSRRQLVRLVFGQLRTDAPRLPADVVGRVLQAPSRFLLDGEALELRALSALAVLDADSGEEIRLYAEHCLLQLNPSAPERLLALWHRRHTFAQPEPINRALVAVLGAVHDDQLSGAAPELVAEAREFARSRRLAP
ncbi:NACHT domain-containing protein [Streptomyces sp. NPDC004726]